jgi:thiamine pyrophosphokinase
MKCVSEIQEKEKKEQSPVSTVLKVVGFHSHILTSDFQQQDIILLGGLSGRLDQTVHTLSYLHKLHIARPRIFAATDDNVAWVLGAVPSSCSLPIPITDQTPGRTFHTDRS